MGIAYGLSQFADTSPQLFAYCLIGFVIVGPVSAVLSALFTSLTGRVARAYIGRSSQNPSEAIELAWTSRLAYGLSCLFMACVCGLLILGGIEVGPALATTIAASISGLLLTSFFWS